MSDSDSDSNSKHNKIVKKYEETYKYVHSFDLRNDYDYEQRSILFTTRCSIEFVNEIDLKLHLYERYISLIWRLLTIELRSRPYNLGQMPAGYGLTKMLPNNMKLLCYCLFVFA